MRNTLLRASIGLAMSVATLLALGTGPDVSPLAAQEASWTAAALRPGDLVRLQVWRDPELNGDYLVDENGMVTLPLIGPREAVRMAPEAFRERVIADLAKELRNQDPVVTLLRRVRVLGEVQAPGLYHVDPTMTLGDVVALAEGSTSEGKLNDIRIVRDGQEIRSDLDTTIPVTQAIQSGDQIMVPKDGWFARNGRWLIGGVISAGGIIAAALIR